MYVIGMLLMSTYNMIPGINKENIHIFSLKIIQTQQAYNCLVHFDWPRAIWKWDLYFNKSNEMESRKCFLHTF